MDSNQIRDKAIENFNRDLPNPPGVYSSPPGIDGLDPDVQNDGEILSIIQYSGPIYSEDITEEINRTRRQRDFLNPASLPPVSRRYVRGRIRELRRRGALILSTGGVGGGYRRALDMGEVMEFIDAEFRSRALDMLYTASRIREAGYKVFGGQVEMKQVSFSGVEYMALPCFNPKCQSTESVGLAFRKSRIENGDLVPTGINIVCRACLTRGPASDSPSEAVRLWNDIPRIGGGNE